MRTFYLQDPSGEKDDPSTQSFGATANPQSEGSVLENKALEGSKSGISDEPVTFKGDSYIFRRFDISQESLDHHYVSEEEQVACSSRYSVYLDLT